MARRRSHLVEVHGSILVGELTASSDALMEKVNARSHAISAWLLPSVNLCLHLQGLPIAVLWIQIIQILSTVRLLLATGRALPLFKLLKGPSVLVMDWDYGLAETLSHESLQLVFDFRLLLLEVV